MICLSESRQPKKNLDPCSAEKWRFMVVALLLQDATVPIVRDPKEASYPMNYRFQRPLVQAQRLIGEGLICGQAIKCPPHNLVCSICLPAATIFASRE